jgi:hypothetical protein
MVELAEDERHEDVAGGDGALRVCLLDGFEAGEGAFVVEVVEVLVGLADLGGEVDRVGVGGGIVRVREGLSCQQERKKKEAEGFDAVFYCCSPWPGSIRCGWNTYLLMQMTGLDAADNVLDARLGKLYPLIPGMADAVVLSFGLNGLYDTV